MGKEKAYIMRQWGIPKFFFSILMKIQLFITYTLQEETG